MVSSLLLQKIENDICIVLNRSFIYDYLNETLIEYLLHLYFIHNLLLTGDKNK